MERSDRRSTQRPVAITTGNSPSRESLRDFKKRMKEKKKLEEMDKEYLRDEYEKAMACGELLRKITAIVFDDEMIKHKCEWDECYPEKPDRYIVVMERIKEAGLLEYCKRLTIEDFGNAEISNMHNPEQLTRLRDICLNFDVIKAEETASKYDAVYFNKNTYDCALLAANATLTLVKSIARGEVQNGLAVVRPPGHHAQYDDFNGYCFFNNVAIAAHYLRTKENVGKILIVDFDVHHGQGTQQMFYDNNNVLYFSIHRYENGTFWPCLRESSFDYIGTGPGVGYNINVPLNATGLGDSDYMAIVMHILLPVAYEFQPDMILFSAGYDACIGCPEFNPDFILVSAGYDSAIGDEKGEMTVSPGFYGHLIKLLSGLANGKLAVIMEGGYFLPSLAEGVNMTLRSLMDDTPAILPALNKPHPEVIATINDLKFTLHEFWGCFKTFDRFDVNDPNLINKLHNVVIKYYGEAFTPPYETRNCYPIQPDNKRFMDIVHNYKLHYGLFKQNKVCYAYHDDMLLHIGEGDTVENPGRVQVVHDRFRELKLDSRCDKVEMLVFNVEQLAKRIHVPNYIANLMKDNFSLDSPSTDMYWHSDGSKISITKALTCLLSVTDAVVQGKYSSGAAIIRPPGHHAESNKSLGFCFVNNVAVAASYAIDKYNLKRVLIVDFDIHHGNGTQEIFYSSNNVLYLSIHKFENGAYFPGSQEGSSDRIGEDSGKGFNINIPFNSEKMGDVEYLNGFFRIILPVAYAYAPELVIVSAGFDAGINDLLGNYKVHPETFGHMIQLLRPLAAGRLIVAMEGGYNLTTLKHSMNFCIKTLLGDPLPKLDKFETPNGSAHRTFEEVIKIQKKFWPILDVDRPLPDRLSGLVLKDDYNEGNPNEEIRKLLERAKIKG